MSERTKPAVAATESYRETVQRLASAQKKRAPGAPGYSIYVNRKVGRFIAAWAYRRGMVPNQVTAISAGFTLLAIILLASAPPSWPLGVAVWLLLAVGYAFDSADGQVARLRGGGSPAGEWLDHVVDATKAVALHLCVAISAYRYFNLPSRLWLLIPLGYAVVASVAFFAMILNDLLKSIHRLTLLGRGGTPAAPSERSSNPVRALLLLPTDYGIFCLVFVTLGWPALFFVLYSLLFLANLGHLGLTLHKWFNDMKQLGATA